MWKTIKITGWLAIACICLLVTGCAESKWTNAPFAADYKKGSKVEHIASGEMVRIMSKWVSFGGDPERHGKDVDYTVRFEDGAEIKVFWNELRRTGQTNSWDATQ